MNHDELIAWHESEAKHCSVAHGSASTSRTRARWEQRRRNHARTAAALRDLQRQLGEAERRADVWKRTCNEFAVNAERYRWLRSGYNVNGHIHVMQAIDDKPEELWPSLRLDELDAAIDAARGGGG